MWFFLVFCRKICANETTLHNLIFFQVNLTMWINNDIRFIKCCICNDCFLIQLISFNKEKKVKKIESFTWQEFDEKFEIKKTNKVIEKYVIFQKGPANKF